MAIYRVGDHIPSVAESAWVADSAQVIGRITLAADSSIWFGSVLRGDNEPLVVGRGSNVQENCVMHADEGFPLVIGEGVSVGHQVMLHGCTIGDGSLIGIQSILLNGARIGKNCLVGAGSLVTEGKTFPDGMLIVGRPAGQGRARADARADRGPAHGRGAVCRARAAFPRCAGEAGMRRIGRSASE